MTKEELFKLIEHKMNGMQKVAVECVELIYKAGFNEGIDKAANIISQFGEAEEAKIRKLKV